MISKKIRKKKIGRPPAKWVHELANLERDDNEYLDYHDLSELFGVTMRTVHGFCTKADVVGEYYKTDSNVVRKRFKVKDLKKAAVRFLKDAHIEHLIF